MYYTCINCKKDLIAGDMCNECASFLRQEVDVPVNLADTPIESVAKKVVKAVKKVVKKKK